MSNGGRMKSILEVSNLTVGYYEDIDILTKINLKVEEGKMVAIIGPNGAGKSTLLKSIFGLLRPRNGNVVFDGQDITGHSASDIIQRGIGYTPQMRALFPQMTVRENLEMGAWVIKKDREKVASCVDRLFKEFPVLEENQDMRATFLSGGQARMLEIAKSLVLSPKMLLIDEPSAGLMPSLCTNVYERLKKMNNDGVSILLVDQRIREAVEIADYVYMISVGANAAEGSGTYFKENLEKILHESLFG
ncbi:MAG: ABC transporter ATP-binding protein [Candidatus Thorarchaeota archaeon]|nr:ABC transporter ATP-binding protein [Candidatus Thorarchaeota archaeon]